MEPLFTIITVTFNAAGVIKPTLESVAAQDCDDFELLVIDGASTDDTVALVNAAAIDGTRVLSEKDRGLYDAMNKGIRLARGRYLIFLNAGDAFAAPDVLSRLQKAASDEPGVLYGQTVLVDDARQVVGKRHLTAPDVLTADSFKRGMLVCHQAFVARRDLVPEYDLQYRFSADFDWCVKVLKKSPKNVYLGPEPLIHFLTGGTTTANHRASLLERYRIMCRHYGRMSATLHHITFIPRFIASKFRG
ncbi:MAG: glycosyltransferase [Muribaculaceae bacterium]|nr:glycosyltransferase [Muribaculaceae bacterium]